MIKLKCKSIWSEYEAGQQYKNSMGDKGIHDQARINERFFVGDQWHGVNAGNEKPLTRRNIIKRIGEYKMATIGAAPIAVNYSAEGVPDTTDIMARDLVKQQLMGGEVPEGNMTDAEVSVVMSALTDYFKVTAERVKYDDKKDQLLRNAYISGTGILYTYWDSTIKTGLYADEGRTMAITGDINCEVLDVENVVFGDPNNEEVESQPYIIIARRMDVEAVRREAETYGQDSESIVPDGQNGYYRNAGDRGEDEPSDSHRVTVLTKLYKRYDDNGNATVWGKTVTENAVVRPEWDLLIHRYPIAKFVWERRRSCAYGDSEITYQIPNQIALNQAHSISVWAMQNTGMPKTVINGDLIPDGISNDPAEVVKIYGSAEDMMSAIRYIAPPNYGAAFINFTDAFAQNVLMDNGANDAALGNMRPDNATAIVQAREAAIAPMQMYQNRFYSANEDVARIWADFWITMYGRRSIKVNDGGATRYMAFDAERYRDLVITAKIDVGASTLWSEAVSIANLGNLLSSQLISFTEYLERIPKGLIPNATGLINARKQQEMAEQQAAMQQQAMAQQNEASVSTDEIGDAEVLEYVKQNRPDVYERLMRLSPEDQQKALTMMRNGATTQTNTQEVGDI
ncbi:MAG: hypothetical protein IKT42_02485 [Clostridia bacterium]|nr:hypothetical protein [Clostridia bacterium]